ncbi:hypothetical protein [Mucilaginibacter paludis]|uniref:Uncharacterized protein n=1 Tax=Mucilaginibacter paludis DSM 18603 TaxID=714943 RepID=H1YHY8_9SPHI|nr:hypothetical protein [Mucilaginibacter paludis]EHQ25536.1 hypothetical protein Mucpa_1376 [Mucilaginibacter paludis DSM 18603]
MIVFNKNAVLQVIFVMTLLCCACKTTNKTQVKCCGINQDIPDFKGDTAFQNIYYPELVSKKILTPIKRSNAPLEIRYTILAGGHTETLVIECRGKAMHVMVYRFGRVNKTMASQYVNSDNIDIGSERAIDKYTTILNVRDLSDRYKTFDWNNLFHTLIKNHFFDLPGDPVYQDSIKKLRPGAYPPDGYINYFEIKVGNQFRNVEYQDSNYTVGVPGLDFVQNEISNQKSLGVFFQKPN